MNRHPGGEAQTLHLLEYVKFRKGMEALDLGGHIVQSRHKQNGDLRVGLPDGLHEFKAVDLRHHNIRDNQAVIPGA